MTEYLTLSLCRMVESPSLAAAVVVGKMFSRREFRSIVSKSIKNVGLKLWKVKRIECHKSLQSEARPFPY